MVSTVNPVIRKLQDNSKDIEVKDASKIHVDKQNNLYVTSTSGNNAKNKYDDKRCNHVTKLINRKNYSVSYDNLTPLVGSLSENNRTKTQFRRTPDYAVEKLEVAKPILTLTPDSSDSSITYKRSFPDVLYGIFRQNNVNIGLDVKGYKIDETNKYIFATLDDKWIKNV